MLCDCGMCVGGKRLSDEVHWVHRQITKELRGGERCLDLSLVCLIEDNERCSGEDSTRVRCETNEHVLRG